MSGTTKMDVDDADRIGRNEIQCALADGNCLYTKDIEKGSFGTVVLATDNVTSSHYAVKMMRLDNDPETRIKYLKRELDLLTKLQLSADGNVIQYFHSWTSKDERILCIKMELCWSSLGTYIKKYSPVIVQDENLYKHCFPQILNGLGLIHSKGWIHRDIHLDNILIANPKPSKVQDIKIKIADFGLARQYDHKSSTNLTVKQQLEKLSPNIGNHLYRAPELSTENYCEKVDLYSAGIVLYLLCRDVNTHQWKDEITELRGGRRGELCHNDVMLVKLLDCLLKTNPDERPSARMALEKFPLTNTDGVNDAPSKSFKFLAVKDDEVPYNRCCATDDSLYGIKVAVKESTGVNEENQVLHQESIGVNGENLLINVNCDKHVREMFKSAEQKNCTVQLVVSEKETAPGTDDQIISIVNL